MFHTTLGKALIQSGINLTIHVNINATTTLLVAGPVVGVAVRLVRMSVVGNLLGFANRLPVVNVTVVNDTAIQLTTSALPGYSIQEAEKLEVLVPTASIVGPWCADDGDVVMGVLQVQATTSQSSTAVTTAVVGAVAAAVGAVGMAGMAADQQGLSAFAMMGCSNPETKESFGSIRVLSPFAVLNSYAGVVLGNAVVLAVVAVIQGVALLVMRVCRRVRRRVELMAATRFPALLLGTSFAFHTGTAFAASQLVSEPANYEPWEVVVGVAAFGYCVVYPVVLIVHPYLRVGRAYQEYALDEWLVERKWPTWVRHIVPQGVMFSPETRRAYGGYVSSYRAPAKQVWWTSYPVWVSAIVGVGGLFHPTTIPGCQALLCSMGLALLAIAALTLRCMPHRSTASSVLASTAKIILALFAFALAVAAGGSTTAVSVSVAIGWLQVAVTIVRIAHTILCTAFDRRMVLEAVMITPVWTHVTGRAVKASHRFQFNGDGEELTGVVAEDDDCSVEKDEALLLENNGMIVEDDDIVLPVPSGSQSTGSHSTPSTPSSTQSEMGEVDDDDLDFSTASAKNTTTTPKTWSSSTSSSSTIDLESEKSSPTNSTSPLSSSFSSMEL